MFEVRYGGGDRAAGSRGMLVQAHAGHLRINIQDFQTQLLGVEYAGLLYYDDWRIQKLTDVVHCGDN